MPNAVEIAKCILGRAKTKGISLDPMKLQKILYFSHGWHLGLTDTPLIDEQIEAWPYGPVVPSVYHEFKKYGASYIPPDEAVDDESCLPPNAVHLVDQVVGFYGAFSGPVLSGMTHEGGSPWDKIWAESKHRSATIPNNIIQEYFKHIKEIKRMY